MRPRLIGLDAGTLQKLAYTIAFFKVEPLVRLKADLVEIVSKALSKDGGVVKLENPYQGGVAKILDIYYDYVIKEDQAKELQRILSIKDPAEKKLRLREYIEDVFLSINDKEVRSILLQLAGEKSALNIARIIQLFPHHKPLDDDPEFEAVLKRYVKQSEIKGSANYILNEWDMERYEAYKKGGLMRLISLQGSYFYLYKKYKISDPDFWLLVEIEEALDEKEPKSKTEKEVVDKLKALIKRRYGIDLEAEAQEMMEIYKKAMEEEKNEIDKGEVDLPIA